jgi:hypothetical protein
MKLSKTLRKRISRLARRKPYQLMQNQPAKTLITRP